MYVRELVKGQITESFRILLESGLARSHTETREMKRAKRVLYCTEGSVIMITENPVVRSSVVYLLHVSHAVSI